MCLFSHLATTRINHIITTLTTKLHFIITQTRLTIDALVIGPPRLIVIPSYQAV